MPQGKIPVCLTIQKLPRFPSCSKPLSGEGFCSLPRILTQNIRFAASWLFLTLTVSHAARYTFLRLHISTIPSPFLLTPDSVLSLSQGKSTIRGAYLDLLYPR